MKVFVYGYANGYDAPEQIAPVVDCCVNELLKLNCRIVWNPAEADVAIAPLLQTKLSDEELRKPKHGTLIFHPSLLPRHRGRDAKRSRSFRCPCFHAAQEYFVCCKFSGKRDLRTF